MFFRGFVAFLAAACCVRTLPTIGDEPTEIIDGLARRPNCGCDRKLPTPTTLAVETTHVADNPPSSSSNFEQGKNPSATPSATYIHSVPLRRLNPGIHWSYDRKPATNIIPIGNNMGTQLYYGITDPSSAGHYAWITYYFNSPSVNLDNCDHIRSIEYRNGMLIVAFGGEEVYIHAADTWPSDELIVVGFIPGCGDYNKGDRCFFKVTNLQFDQSNLRIIIQGQSFHPDSLISKGETEWGWWSPRSSAGSQYSELGATWTVTQPVGPTQTPYSQLDDTPKNRMRCQAPTETKHGLPSACLGDFFDQDLDDDLGFERVSDSCSMFLSKVAPSLGETGTDKRTPEPNAGRHVPRGDSPAPKSACTLCGVFTGKEIKNVSSMYTARQHASSIPGSIKKGLSWKLPDPDSEDDNAKTLQDPSVKQIKSPWGDSILLNTLGTQPENENRDKMENEGNASIGGANSGATDSVNTDEEPTPSVLERADRSIGDSDSSDGQLNIFCVGCGAHGTARVAGTATWNPTDGLTQGQLELNIDMKLVLQLGIDAKMKYTDQFNHSLFEIGLPGLSYGVVTIDPRISVGSKVDLDATTEGRLLAGAEMGLHNAHALIDLIQPNKSKNSGWEPYFNPVFEATGQPEMAASLGLPVAIKCDVKISKWTVSAGILDEPSIQSVAKAPAIIGSKTARSLTTGRFSADFSESDGCTGVRTAMTWRNKLFVQVGDFNDTDLFDTKDNILARRCIKLPGRRGDGDSTLGASDSPVGINSTGSSDNQNRRNFNDHTDVDVPDQHMGRSPPNATANIEENIIGLTDQMKEANTSDQLSYSVQGIKKLSYSDADGTDYALLMDPNGRTHIVSCSDGNMYAAMINGSDNPFCSERWAFQQDTLIADGTHRVLYYYNNTVSALGVSRLRVADISEIPVSGVVVAWAPYFGNGLDHGKEYAYLAVDPYDGVFYPIVCDFEDGTGSKVFLATDPDEGPELLESPDLIYTITGGKVKGCYSIWLLKERYGSENDYAS